MQAGRLVRLGLKNTKILSINITLYQNLSLSAKFFLFCSIQF